VKHYVIQNVDGQFFCGKKRRPVQDELGLYSSHIWGPLEEALVVQEEFRWAWLDTVSSGNPAYKAALKLVGVSVSITTQEPSREVCEDGTPVELACEERKEWNGPDKDFAKEERSLWDAVYLITVGNGNTPEYAATVAHDAVESRKALFKREGGKS
jgi:hypothetical protein